MKHPLPPDALAQYKRAGYHFPLEVLTPAEVRNYREKLEAFEWQHGKLSGAQRNKMHLVFTWLDELVRHARVLDAVESFLGPDLLCWSSSFFIKEPRHPGFVSWHQDATYWGLSSSDVTTAWIALSPATPANGGMKFIPGSHLHPVGHRETYAADNLLSRGQAIEVEVEEREAVHVVLEPGQASLHHTLLFHGSEANTSDERRIGIAVRYIPTYVRQLTNARDSAMLVRGRDRYGNFDFEPRPTTDCSPKALALHAKISARSEQILFRGAAPDRTFR